MFSEYGIPHALVENPYITLITYLAITFKNFLVPCQLQATVHGIKKFYRHSTGAYLFTAMSCKGMGGYTSKYGYGHCRV